ncbi:MAG: bifunctional 5,10-methylene-tetrahydrofolate dehydrogenase/5,10-methylene-tetrahydrofolate cyclohydrolase [Muribaculaceae bacterium]|nr:bifunctional 5,10-methylene-tetrahydrofolate dehydrogenase/5,10-methylene-tetrahydrofolate cyclohydrolase [Muribaculaceae bacterium]
MTLIDGKAVAADIRAEIRTKVDQIVASGKRPPCLVAILVGHDGGSETYVASKVKACAECGFTSRLLRFEESVSQEELLSTVRSLNLDDEVDGFIVQLPLPKHIDEQAVILAVDPEKDVDGFHPVNVGRLSLGLPGFVSATPLGIVELIRRYNIPTEGRHVAVLGRSNIVGRPIASLLSQKGYPGNATVTLCHSRTPDIADICRRADIIVAALGSPKFVTEDMVSDGVAIIDVGTTRVADPSRPSGFRLCGDVDFENVAPHCSYITPVPGGVGPMTIASLMLNTLRAAQR